MTERWTAGAAQDYRWFRNREPRVAPRTDRLIDDIKRRPPKADCEEKGGKAIR
jgi:Txe/YoeB family toxin of Txe-Axe toxin-antitoxin module